MISFNSAAQEYLLNKEANEKFDEAVSQRSRVNIILRYVQYSTGEKDIPIDNIDQMFINRFFRWFTLVHNSGKPKPKDSTVANYKITMRTIWNLAIEMGADNSNYPFGKGKMSVVLPDSLKIGLNADELNRLIDLDLKPASALFHARNIIIYSYAFAGVRISDSIKTQFSDLIDGRLFYTMGKNNKPGSVKISELAQTIIDYYRNNTNGTNYIFPYLKNLQSNDPKLLAKRVNASRSTIRKYCKVLAEMANINKKLTPHIMRHTFANIAGDKIPIQVLQMLYRHGSPNTTIAYQRNFIHKTSDNAIDMIVDGILSVPTRKYI